MEKWNTNRLPTKMEQRFGLAASLFLVALFLSVSIFTLINAGFVTSLVFLALTFFIARIAYRAAFGNPEMPSNRAATFVNYLFIVGGVALLLLALFQSNSSTALFAASTGATGLWAGMYNLRANAS